MPDVYQIMLDAELSKAFDVWSGYLNARTGEDPEARARLRSTLDAAREAAAADDHAFARTLVAEMYDDAQEAGLPGLRSRPTPVRRTGRHATTPRTTCARYSPYTCVRNSTASRST
ncbi:hypothetical protein SHKM778_35530 [Streptomyces sp. KM77-8]|uniref:Uncharacterized protein n=1 Tax=Streptomyces haneummycinicus TaxID=3074435 RepID=A0AAT9HIL5_9ACTN